MIFKNWQEKKPYLKMKKKQKAKAQIQLKIKDIKIVKNLNK